jgi:hypothetical protein
MRDSWSSRFRTIRDEISLVAYNALETDVYGECKCLTNKRYLEPLDKADWQPNGRKVAQKKGRSRISNVYFTHAMLHPRATLTASLLTLYQPSLGCPRLVEKIR